MIYYFGYPEDVFYLTEDSRFVIFRFSHELGNLFAFLFFRGYDYPVILESDVFDYTLDRGNLVELQFELDVPLAYQKIGKVRRRLGNGRFKFVVFQGKVIGRVFAKGKINALSFINPNLIPKPEKSFMAKLFFWLDSKPSLWHLRELEKEAAALPKLPISFSRN